MTIKMVFLVVIGAVILVAGTTGLKRQIRLKKAGVIGAGKVLRAKHIQKRDEENYLIQNYYELHVEYSKDGRRKIVDINSIDQYCPGDQIHLTEDADRKKKIKVSGEEREAVFSHMIPSAPQLAVIVLCFSSSPAVTSIHSLPIFVKGLN